MAISRKLLHLMDEYCGRATRCLIENHRKSRPTPKTEIKSALELCNSRINDVLLRAQEHLQWFGIEMVGLSSDKRVCSVSEGDRLFLRKIFREPVKRVKGMVTPEERRMYTVFSLIQVENNSLDGIKLPRIQKCKYFDSVKVEEFFKKYKMHGYLCCKDVGDTTLWSLGWRFYVEFGDSPDIIDHFRQET